MKVTPEQKLAYKEYVADAKLAKENLSFLLDNLGEREALKNSVEDLKYLEALYYKLDEYGDKLLGGESSYLDLLGKYLGQLIVEDFGGKWKQSTDQNPMLGQPCVDGFGNKNWDRVFPVSIALGFDDLAKTNPNFPGVKTRTVFASQYEKAKKLANV